MKRHVHIACLQKAAAYEHHQIQIEEMLDNEKKAQSRQAEDDRQALELQLHRVKFLLGVV